MCLGLVRAAESVYVSNFIEGTVVRIGADGTKTILGKDLGYPAGIAADRAGRIFVASGNTNRVRILTGEGSGQTFGSTPVRAGYTAIPFDGSGILYVAAGHGLLPDSEWNRESGCFGTNAVPNFPVGTALASLGRAKPKSPKHPQKSHDSPLWDGAAAVKSAAPPGGRSGPKDPR